MLVGNRLEVIMVHNLPIIVVCTSFSNQTYMERGLQSVEGGEREQREREGRGEEEGGRIEREGQREREREGG